mmetsp:Transcript_36011/g.113938  ORF Transcript_36011/g.113938 Transcript_36011/m.113938 type:complete len:205 (+) Transcript_36011:103-717(+)
MPSTSPIPVAPPPGREEGRGSTRPLCSPAVTYRHPAPPIAAFFEAGQASKEAGMLNQAFVFLNRYLDLADAIDDPDNGVLENSDFVHTDIPFDYPLPDQHYLDEDKREEVRDWVLALSMDQQVDQSLSTRTCGHCGTETYAGSLTCHECKARSETCVVTGWPVRAGERVQCKSCDRHSQKEDWNAYINRYQTCPACNAASAPIY